MKLRKFLYLDKKIIDDYLSSIEGYDYDSELLSTIESTDNTLKGTAGLKFFSGEGAHTGRNEERLERSVKISSAAKFNKVYKFLEDGDGEEKLQKIKMLSEGDFDSIEVDDFLEVSVIPRFSKMKEYADSAKAIKTVIDSFQNYTDHQFLDKNTKQAFSCFSALDQIQSGKAISCVFEFANKKYPLVAKLNDENFMCNHHDLLTEVKVLCKVVGKIPKDKNVELDEIFENVTRLPLNREQRRALKKQAKNPQEFRDVVKGPALSVMVIAIYQ